MPARIRTLSMPSPTRTEREAGRDLDGCWWQENAGPVLILQDDRFDMTDSATVCAFTTDPADAPLFRLLIKSSETDGLRADCRLMVDKVTTVPKTKIGANIGRLTDEDMVRLNRALLVFLGIAAPTKNEQLRSP